MQVYCDAGCPVCIHKRRKETTGEEGEDIFYYCDYCKSVYLCPYPLKRKLTTYACMTCRDELASDSLSKAFEIGLSSRITTRFLNGTLFKNVWTEHNVYQSRQQRMLAEKLPYWFEGGDILIASEVLDDHVEYLRSNPGLTVPVISEVLSRTNLASLPDYPSAGLEPEYLFFSQKKDKFLDSLAEYSPATIEYLYRVLEGKKTDDYFSLLINIMCRRDLFDDSVYISTNIPHWLEGIVDLIGMTENGKFIWLIIVKEAQEEDFVNNLMNMLLSLHSLSFANLDNIYIIAENYSWITREIIKRQTTINTVYGKTSLKLFTIDELYKTVQAVA